MTLREIAVKLDIHPSYVHRLAVRFARGRKITSHLIPAGFYFSFDSNDLAFFRSKLRPKSELAKSNSSNISS